MLWSVPCLAQSGEVYSTHDEGLEDARVVICRGGVIKAHVGRRSRVEVTDTSKKTFIYPNLSCLLPYTIRIAGVPPRIAVRCPQLTAPCRVYSTPPLLGVQH